MVQDFFPELSREELGEKLFYVMCVCVGGGGDGEEG